MCYALPDSTDQFIRIDGLFQDVTEITGCEVVGVRARDDHDGDPSRVRVRHQLALYVSPTHPRQHEIEQDYVGQVTRIDQPERIAAIFHSDHGENRVGQHGAVDVPQRGVVFDDEDGSFGERRHLNRL